MNSSNASDRRKSTRKKCPVKNAVPVVYMTDEELYNVKVKLKNYRIIASSKENIHPNGDAETRHKNKPNISNGYPSDESSDDEILADMMRKKYPMRKKVPVKKSLHVSNSKKDDADDVLSENTNRNKKVPVKKIPVNTSNIKNVLADNSSKKNIPREKTAVNVRNSKENTCASTLKAAQAKNQNTRTKLESDDSSEEKVLIRKEDAVKKSSADTFNTKEIDSSGDVTKVTHTDKLVTNMDIESDKTSDDEISDIEMKSEDRKTYPQRKRKGGQGTHIENESNNSLYKTALHKKMKSTSVNNGSSTVLQESEEMNKYEEGCCDDIQMESEVDQDAVEILPDVFNSAHSTKAQIDEAKVGGGDLEDMEAENNDELMGEDNLEEENVIRARVLTSNALDGQSIYGFVTPKRKDALAKIAQDVIESAKKSSKKSSSKGSRKSVAATPKSSSKKPGKGSISKDDNDTKEPDKKARNKVTLLRTLAANDCDDDDDDDDDEELSESDESDEDEESLEKNKDERDLLDQYFEVHGKFKSLTSDKTLAKLKNPKMNQQELLEHLKDIQTSHVKEIVKLHGMHQCQYKNWMFNLLSGFNVLVYGFGSKHMLLEKFRKTMLQDQMHIVVNGFFPSIQLKSILKTITEEILEKETSFKNTIEHYKYITNEYNSGTSGKLFIIIHNIDGHMLRSQNVQTALAHLASSRNIHIIASIDHISAPLIWDQNRSSAFNWLWYDTTTFESYSEETSYENSLMVQQSGTLALSSLKHVLHSLTSNSKGIFRVLADYHIDNEDNTAYQGMSFGDLYQRCRERFLVNSDLTLRGQLTEFKDHKLIKSKKGFDGVDYLSIALDCSTLKIYLEEEDS